MSPCVADHLVGGTSKDVLVAATGPDLLQGGDGADSLDGGSQMDALYGQDGADELFGGTGNDLMYGGAGDDAMRLTRSGEDLGADFADCGGGRDTVYVEAHNNDDITDTCETIIVVRARR